MSDFDAVLAIVVGALAILFGCTTKQFYAAKGNLGVTMTNRKIPLWAGRLLSLIVGGFFIFVGIKFFVIGR